jgi:sialic acid synthase SpsE
LGLAAEAKAAGMRAIVIKNHYVPTADRAELAMEEVGGIEVFGGIVLNRSVGGLNAEAVRRMIQFTGHRGVVVWLPTMDAEAAVRASGVNRPFVPVVKDGQPVPELAEIFQIIAQNDLIFETGRSTSDETLILIAAAKKAGVKKIVVTHAMAVPLNPATDAQLQRMADLGAVIECLWYANLAAQPTGPTANNPNQVTSTVADYARVIKAIGAEHFLLSTDMGQPGHPSHTEAMREFIAALKKNGLSDHDIDLVARQNPARLLGLPVVESK